MDETNTPTGTDNTGKAAGPGSSPAETRASAPELQELQDTEIDRSHQENNQSEKETVKDLTALYEVPVQVSAVLGRATMQVHQLLKLGRGAVIELDRKVGEAIDVYVNNRLVARGEVVIVEEHLGITMTEIVKSDRS
jgi:flagellar motor switch protein FliN/FliY